MYILIMCVYAVCHFVDWLSIVFMCIYNKHIIIFNNHFCCRRSRLTALVGPVIACARCLANSLALRSHCLRYFSSSCNTYFSEYIQYLVHSYMWTPLKKKLLTVGCDFYTQLSLYNVAICLYICLYVSKQ